MNLFKRALYSVTRKKGKSIILLIIIFVLGNVMAGSIAISQATENVERNIKSMMGGTATIDIDYENIEDKSDFSGSEITPELIEKVGALSSVKYYDYESYYGLRSKGLKLYVPEELVGMMGPEASENGEYIPVRGVHYAAIKDIVEGEWKVNGRTFNDSEINQGSSVAVISMDFAEENNLNIGDTISLKNIVLDYDDMAGKGAYAGEEETLAEEDVTLEIIGIFEPKLLPENQNSDSQGMSEETFINMERQNTIYVTNGFVKKLQEFSTNALTEKHQGDPDYDVGMYSGNYYQATFVLTSPDVETEFKEEASSMLPKNYIIYLNSDNFAQIAGPIYTIRNLSTIVLYVAIAATILILTLLIILFLRDRRYEFGVYLALGEQRFKIISQVLLEIMVIGFIGISASLVTGNMLASSISQSMLISQMEASEEDSMMGKSYSINMEEQATNEDILENYKVSLGVTYILMIYGIGLGTILIAVIGPTIYILRLNPKKIMM